MLRDLRLSFTGDKQKVRLREQHNSVTRKPAQSVLSCPDRAPANSKDGEPAQRGKPACRKKKKGERPP